MRLAHSLFADLRSGLRPVSSAPSVANSTGISGNNHGEQTWRGDSTSTSRANNCLLVRSRYVFELFPNKIGGCAECDERIILLSP